MTIQEILNKTEHRPWKIPNENWKFYQEWNDAIFLHWQVDLTKLRELVPKELEIDLFNGNPWVSMVAFTMEKVRPKNLPAFSPISNFDEINIRTYVKSNNKAGVYFLSIEAGSNLSCKIAKAISELPYRYSKVNRNEGLFESSNPKFGDRLTLEYQIGNTKNNKTELDKWLTERYALFQDTSQSINEFEIHHLEWPIDEIKLKDIKSLLSKILKNLITNNPQLSHYSKGVKVIAWGKNKTYKIKLPSGNENNS